jgi:ribonuclease P/MRP protein subunit POP5
MVFEALCEAPVQGRELMSEIFIAQSSLLGDMGAAAGRLRLISFDGRFGIIRCSHERVDETRAVMATVRSVASVRVALAVKGTSGTIAAATEKYIPRLVPVKADKERRRVELEEVAGWIVQIQGREIDLSPDDENKARGSDTRYMGLTSFDLFGGCDDADGTSDGV